MRGYESYRRSNIPWADSIPTGWGEICLRWYAVIYAGGTPSKAVDEYWQNGNIPWLNSGSVNQDLITEPSAFISESAYKNSSAKWIPKGALLLALAGQGKTKGMVAQLDFRATCNQSMAAIVPNNKLQSRYLFYWLKANYLNIRSMGGGDLRDGLNLEMLSGIKAPLPSDDEQQLIGRYLDRETARIDNLIVEKQNFIDLLKEKRQALISHVVTKGLNPNVKMKDSGIEWIGEVPEHWVLPKLFYVVDKVGDGLHGTPEYEDGTEIYFVNGNNLIDGKVVITDKTKEVSNTSYLQHFIQLDTSTVFLSINGTIGNVALYNKQQLVLGKSAAYINCKQCLAPEFLMYVFQSNVAKYYFDLEVTGTTIYNLSLQSIREFKIPLPPVHEQKEIVEYVRSIKGKFSKLGKEVSLSLDLLKEHRTALISAAVTGKIDVRTQL